MDWLNNYKGTGKEIRDELNRLESNVTAFPLVETQNEVIALGKYRSIFNGLGLPVPHLASTKDFYDYMMLPSTAEALKEAIIFNIRKAREFYAHQH